MKIVSAKICPFVQRVTALLALKQAKYDITFIDLSDKPKWFLEKSPHGQVPILITDENEVLFESDAIVEYIDEAITPQLFNVSLIRKAQQRAWSYLASKNYLVQCSTQRSKTKEILAEKSARFTTIFAKLEDKLGNTTFFDGDTIGMVDIAWLPLLHRAHIIEKKTGYDFIDGFHKVQALQQNILQSDICERSVSEDFEDIFSDFYLSEETFLGQCVHNNFDKSHFGTGACRDNNFDRCC